VEQGVYLGLDGRAALVTGAGAGVGRAVAFWLARAGCDVAIVDLSRDAAEGVADELRELDYTAIAVAADLRSDRGVEAMVAEVVDKFDSLDVAVNCPAPPAGRPGRAGAHDGERSSDLARAVMASCCRAEAAAMRATGEGGALVNVAWGWSEEGLRGAEGTHGIDDLTRTLAADLGPSGVRVNAILAIISTRADARRAVAPERPRTGALERAVPAEDIGRVAVFLASNLSRKVSGQTLRVEADVPPGGAAGVSRTARRGTPGPKRG
jgi:3-oxoacyl-[acyl-carrier protein] reductase